MTDSYFAEDAAHSPMIDLWEYAFTPGNFGSTPATLYSPSPAPRRATDQSQSGQLGFLPFAEWEEGGEYDEEALKYVCYTIEWKVILNRKAVGRVTEENLVVAPGEYWQETLKADVEGLLQMKKKSHQRVRSEGTDITMKSNDRSQRKIEKFHRSTNIDWKPVEKQLRKWSNLLRIGKKLTIAIAFNYRSEDDDQSTSEGPMDKKHYKLRTPHLERLIDHVDGGGSLDCHADIPSDIRRDLVLESQIGRKSKKAETASAGPWPPYPPTVINVLPAQTASWSTVTSFLPKILPDEPLVIPGSRETAVRDYCKWLESRATDEEYKADFRKICQVTLNNRLDLELILEDSDAGFFVQRGIQIGTARRFLRDINEWSRVTKLNVGIEQGARDIIDDTERI
ncbi:hypothetical protein N7516_008926 [Penicillium verrucosum]|uniref:uncharacterized protein n=1 Tax=Penicillium verrucosum TaxID=60171 RepID=UPI002545528F|nr:uncharacterized protein N7516_008926 [Penicillium verrucosum]KAJ5927153.1 hypothetical protein N7516_008926 [Penicillium verrucosum]